uniref:Uncharacterized protein n=1 Tax=Tanacetum cinerariifolium TaxID=118510 RepID=A0A699I593_TANCI|nr:hypothetical protein [Tanacetum cinerariifolium]
MPNPHLELASPDQMISGKDSSNPLMIDNLPKIIWYSTQDVALMKSWLVQNQTALGQTTTGKEISNPFMAGRKFNFSRYIFDSLVMNVDSSTELYMYLRFLQLMIREQVGDLSSHSIKYSSLALTQKVFANMRRVEKGFFGVDTPLFKGMLVAQQVDEGAGKVNINDVHVADEGGIISNMDADEDVTLQDVADIAKDVAVDAEIEESADIQGRQVESQAQIYQINLKHADKVLSMQDDELETTELQEVVEVVTTAKLMTEVVTAASATITAADTSIPAATITAVAPTLTTTHNAAKRRKEVVIRDPKETATPSTIIHTKP